LPCTGFVETVETVETDMRAVSLGSSDADGMTGQSILLDGGMLVSCAGAE
jgi:hypothetical protein